MCNLTSPPMQTGESKPFLHNVFVLGSCTPIVGNDVRCFDSEKDMLLAWRDFIVEVDPDIIIGYNIMNFDIPYLWDRAAALKLKDFSVMSRIKNETVQIRDSLFSSKAYGTKESHEVCTLNFLDSGNVVFLLNSNTVLLPSNDWSCIF